MQFQLTAPKNLNIDALRPQVALEPEEGLRVIAKNRLIRIAGGLYRIRDNYKGVWSMVKGEDGRSYIVSADDQNDRMVVSEDENLDGKKEAGQAWTEEHAQKYKIRDEYDEIPPNIKKILEDRKKNPNWRKEESIKEASAFKVIRAGQVHLFWECIACKTANMTKFGNQAECDYCHRKYSNNELLEDDTPPKLPDKYTRAEVEPWIANRMKREGINLIDKSLLELWSKEAGQAWTEEHAQKYDISDKDDEILKKMHEDRKRKKNLKEAEAPKGWEGTVKKMKKHMEIDNPWALAHWMQNKGYESHK